MRRFLLALPLLLGAAAPAQAQISLGIGIGIDVPGLSIGINLPSYPTLQRVPGYPVYYAPRADSNYFFYDGVYWVFQSDDWYASSWYNGPWRRVGREAVPVYVLRVPVRYYRQPPGYFSGWRADAPPRWGERWGRDWEQTRPDWNRWDRRNAPAPAPLPTYQQKYPQSRYPQADEQRNIRRDQYRYQAREPVVRQQFLPPEDHRVREAPRGSAPPPARPRQTAPPQRGPGNDDGRDRGNRGERGDRGGKPDKDDREDDRGGRGGGPRH